MGYYPIEVREKAIALREKGYSLKEVSDTLHIAKSTSSLWLRNISLSQEAQNRLKEKHTLKQYKASLSALKKREEINQFYKELVLKDLYKIRPTKGIYKLICSLLFWCEGSKNFSHVRFTNSDPTLIKLFLFTFRRGFNIDESKLRILMHLHDYHDENIQKEFWSKTTEIPLSQFLKTYHKPHTGKNIHENYPGCIALYYYGSKVAKELQAIYNCIADRGVVQW